MILVYRACLVASIRSSGVSQSTIKLVATNLIANGKLTGKSDFYIVYYYPKIQNEAIS